jgi:hypothetical protein
MASSRTTPKGLVSNDAEGPRRERRRLLVPHASGFASEAFVA